MRRLIARASLVALLTGTGLAVAAPAQAAACTGTTGVTVVVQSSGGPEVRCAKGDPSSAAAALSSAGWSIQQAQSDPGFICRISGVPDISCARPSKTDYWAFHHAPAGGSWTYATKGAYGYNPKPGTVVGFRLGTGTAPSIAPPKAAAAKSRDQARSGAPSTGSGPSASTGSNSGSTTSNDSGEARSGTRGSNSSDSAGSGTSDTESGSAAPSAKQGSGESTSPPSKSSKKAAAKKKQAQDSAKAEAAATEARKKRAADEANAAAAKSATKDETKQVDGGVGGSVSALVPTAVGGGLLIALGGGAVIVARRRRN